MIVKNYAANPNDGNANPSGFPPEKGLRILVVEDNAVLQYGLRQNLEFEGHEVFAAATIQSALRLFEISNPDVVILDLMLPDGDGIQLVTEFKERRDCAVVILSAKAGEMDRVRAFQLGADDYVTKPFSLLELLERVRIRAATLVTTHVTIGSVKVDFVHQTVKSRNKKSHLTPQEVRLLRILTANAGRCVSRAQLLSDAWGYSPDASTRTVDHYIQTLRQKIEDVPTTPKHLLTLRGRGYMLRF